MSKLQRPLRGHSPCQGPIFWQPNSTLPGGSLPVYDHHLLVIFASFCADSIPAMVAPPRRPRSRCAACALAVRSEIGPYQHTDRQELATSVHGEDNWEQKKLFSGNPRRKTK